MAKSMAKKKPENMPINISKAVCELSELEHKDWTGTNESKLGVWGRSKKLDEWMLQDKAMLLWLIHLCWHCHQWGVFWLFADDTKTTISLAERSIAYSSKVKTWNIQEIFGLLWSASGITPNI